MTLGCWQEVPLPSIVQKISIRPPTHKLLVQRRRFPFPKKHGCQLSTIHAQLPQFLDKSNNTLSVWWVKAYLIRTCSEVVVVFVVVHKSESLVYEITSRNKCHFLVANVWNDEVVVYSQKVLPFIKTLVPFYSNRLVISSKTLGWIFTGTLWFVRLSVCFRNWKLTLRVLVLCSMGYPTSITKKSCLWCGHFKICFVHSNGPCVDFA